MAFQIFNKGGSARVSDKKGGNGSEQRMPQNDEGQAGEATSALLDVTKVNVPETGGFKEEELPPIPKLPPFPSFISDSSASQNEVNSLDSKKNDTSVNEPNEANDRVGSEETENRQPHLSDAVSPPRALNFVNKNQPKTSEFPSETDKELQKRQELQTVVQEALLKNGKPVKPKLAYNTDYTSPTFFKELFDNGNVCITAPGGSLPIK